MRNSLKTKLTSSKIKRITNPTKIKMDWFEKTIGTTLVIPVTVISLSKPNARRNINGMLRMERTKILANRERLKPQKRDFEEIPLVNNCKIESFLWW